MTYPGGKNGAGVFQRIINLMPPHDVYIEPFLGSGAVMRLKRAARLNIGVDLDAAALKLAMPPGHQHRSSAAMAPAGVGLDGTAPEAILPGTAGNGDEARAVILENADARRHRSSVPAMPDPFRSGDEVLRSAEPAENGDVRSRRRPSVPAMSDPLTNGETSRIRLPRAPVSAMAPIASSGDGGRDKVRNADLLCSPEDAERAGLAPMVRFFHGDGMEFLERYRFSGNGRELVYCDPPYMMLSQRSGKAVYTHEFSEDQHLRLLRLLRRLPCLVLISGYWSALYAQELKAWNHIQFEAMTRKGLKTEWLWFNFPPPVQLHDYRYLGRGFRERERIKRKTARWTKKLAAMPTLERQALLSAIAGVCI